MLVWCCGLYLGIYVIAELFEVGFTDLLCGCGIVAADVFVVVP